MSSVLSFNIFQRYHIVRKYKTLQCLAVAFFPPQNLTRTAMFTTWRSRIQET